MMGRSDGEARNWSFVKGVMAAAALSLLVLAGCSHDPDSRLAESSSSSAPSSESASVVSSSGASLASQASPSAASSASSSAPLAASSASQTSASARSQQPPSTTEIDTPYYHVSIPDGWPPDLVTGITYDVNEELRNPQDGGMGIGCTTTVHIGGGDILITCFTDNWGPQGDFAAEVVGAPEALPGWRVIVYTIDPSVAGGKVARDLSGYLAEFATFVSLGPVGAAQPEGADQGGAAQDGADRSDAAEGFRARLDDINAAWGSDPRAAGTTQAMIEAGNDFCGRYDQLMTEVYAYVEGLPGSDAEALAASQDMWSAQMSERMRQIEAEYAGGSQAGPAMLSTKMEMQRARIEQLVDMI